MELIELEPQEDVDIRLLQEKRGTVELSPEGEIIVSDIFYLPVISGGNV